MKVFVSNCLTLAIAGLISFSASAQNDTASGLDQVLVKEQGLTLVSDGLYARTSANSEAYVAVNPAGLRALRQRLVDLRDKITHASSVRSGTPVTSLIDRSIEELSQPQLDNSQTGGCGGTTDPSEPRLSATALSGGGTGASATAVLTEDFSPVTGTTNRASAETDNGLGNVTSSQSSTTAATVPATASATAPSNSSACTAFSSASVTCPGHTSPSVMASAFSQKVIPHGSCLL